MKKMNTTKKIAIALAVMVVAAMAAPAVMGDEAAYTVTVLTGQDTSIGAVTGAFGDVLRGTSKEITDSFTLTNSGDWNATVNATFTTSNSTGTYGLNSSTGDIALPGNNFGLKAVGLGETTYTYLASTSTETLIPGEVPPNSTPYNYDAILNVPVGQSAEAYSGTILLTFSNA